MSEKVQPGVRGSALWALNRYRRDALTSLLDDLVSAEEDGFQPEECRLVRQALERGANMAAQIPDGGFMTILGAFENLVKHYEKWNDPTGTDPATVKERRARMRRLRKTRKKLAERIRRNTHALDKNLDLRIVEAQYTALEELTRALPKLLPKLTKAVVRFTTSA